MVEKILNNTTPYGKNRASHEGSLHSSTLKYRKSTLCVAGPRYGSCEALPREDVFEPYQCQSHNIFLDNLFISTNFILRRLQEICSGPHPVS